ncbi:MAG: hypothetical protein ACI4NZ_01330 [Candidatus Enterousia sp.]
MKNNIIKSLRIMFPFLLTIALWRLSTPFWNPGGILALIPIFYCVFVRHMPWFGIFGAIMCFLIDYKFNTTGLWLAIYCLFYAVNGFQTIIDLARMDRNAINAFMVFIGVGIIITIFTGFGFINILRGIWIFIFMSLLYMPTALLIKRVRHD